MAKMFHLIRHEDAPKYSHFLKTLSRNDLKQMQNFACDIFTTLTVKRVNFWEDVLLRGLCGCLLSIKKTNGSSQAAIHHERRAGCITRLKILLDNLCQRRTAAAAAAEVWILPAASRSHTEIGFLQYEPLDSRFIHKQIEPR